MQGFGYTLVAGGEGDGEGGPGVGGNAVGGAGRFFGAAGADGVDQCLADVRVFSARGAAQVQFDGATGDECDGGGVMPGLQEAAGPEDCFDAVVADGHAAGLEALDR